MLVILGWVLIGIAVAVMLGSLVARAGRDSPMSWNVAAGAIGGFIGGYIFGSLSPTLFGVGPEFIFSLLGAAVGSAVAVFIVRAVKK